MSYRLVLRAEAESDLAEAFEWYEQRRRGLGESLLLSVEATLLAIQEAPLLFPAVYRNIRRALTRRFPFGVFYVLEGEAVVVLAVFHASRNPKGWQSRGS